MSHEQPTRMNPEAIKQAIDLVKSVQQYTNLHRISRAGEYAGPCPRCGGEDRFHVKDRHFYCRQCYPRGGDVIDLVQLLHNAVFVKPARGNVFFLKGIQTLLPNRRDLDTRLLQY